MPFVDVKAGSIRVEDTGGDGPVVVLCNGVIMDDAQWAHVVDDLRADHRCVSPVLPLGAHSPPMHPDADLSLRGQANIVADLLDALELEDVTLCFNDWCGAQLLAASGRTERVGRMVLVSCETAGNYPPGLPGRFLGLLGRIPGGLRIGFELMRFRPVRRMPNTLGWMSVRPIPRATSDRWVEPARRDPAIRRDLAKYVADVGQAKRDLAAATSRMSRFTAPVLVVWGADDRVMPSSEGRALASGFPSGEYVEIPRSGTLVPLDQPALLAGEIRAFVAASLDRATDDGVAAGAAEGRAR